MSEYIFCQATGENTSFKIKNLFNRPTQHTPDICYCSYYCFMNNNKCLNVYCTIRLERMPFFKNRPAFTLPAVQFIKWVNDPTTITALSLCRIALFLYACFIINIIRKFNLLQKLLLNVLVLCFVFLDFINSPSFGLDDFHTRIEPSFIHSTRMQGKSVSDSFQIRRKNIFLVVNTNNVKHGSLCSLKYGLRDPLMLDVMHLAGKVQEKLQQQRKDCARNLEFFYCLFDDLVFSNYTQEIECLWVPLFISHS